MAAADKIKVTCPLVGVNSSSFHDVTSISTSELATLSKSVTLPDPVLRFLNGKSTPIFVLNSPTPPGPVPAFEAVLTSPEETAAAIAASIPFK